MTNKDHSACGSLFACYLPIADVLKRETERKHCMQFILNKNPWKFIEALFDKMVLELKEFLLRGRNVTNRDATLASILVVVYL